MLKIIRAIKQANQNLERAALMDVEASIKADKYRGYYEDTLEENRELKDEVERLKKLIDDSSKDRAKRLDAMKQEIEQERKKIYDEGYIDGYTWVMGKMK